MKPRLLVLDDEQRMVDILAMVLHLGPMGVFLAIPITELAVIISSYLVFRKGNWKKVKI